MRELVVRCMEDAAELRVRLIAECGVGSGIGSRRISPFPWRQGFSPLDSQVRIALRRPELFCPGAKIVDSYNFLL